MNQTLLKAITLCTLVFTGAFIPFVRCSGQNTVPGDSSYRTIVAGSQYATSSQHQKRWGKHYREEWNTPVKVKVVMLDTLEGGLTAYQEGGGRQSKTLRLRDAKGREYVLRSIDKSFGKALPE